MSPNGSKITAHKGTTTTGGIIIHGAERTLWHQKQP